MDTRNLGTIETRKLRVLDDADVAKIADTYHAWRNHDGEYADVPGLVRSSKLWMRLPAMTTC